MQLIDKYNIPGPRYTSYPTVPYWDRVPLVEEWKEHVIGMFNQTRDKGISLYIHLPFCESLCTYCGCNTRITVNHAVEGPYIDSVLKEWKMYAEMLPSRPAIRELHLGGGTPTFFSPDNLKRLIEGIFQLADKSGEAEFSFEGHPANTTQEHLTVLYELGFRRISLGIQDFDPVVQDTIHRFQTVEQVETVTGEARKMGYHSVNYDLIYGLPKQVLPGIIDTISKTILLKPDRIAFYSYAHVPWIKPGQRKFTEKDLPEGKIKRMMYETGRKMLEAAGYQEIGMDHFALPGDSLVASVNKNTLHRNFMGYTTTDTSLLIGLGVSSIGDSWTAFAQNVKVLEKYSELVNNSEFPINKGHVLNDEDMILRRHILNLMCRFETDWQDDAMQCEALYEGIERLQEMDKDGLVCIRPYSLAVNEKGRPFIRNVCMALDARLWRKLPDTTIFSQTV